MRVLSLFDGKYDVTSEGKVFSNVGKRKILKGKVSNCGYHIVLLTIDNKKRYFSVHRLVAESFIFNPNNFPQVNHKDGNKLNNNIDNLEWCTSKENHIHARDNGLYNFKIDMDIANEIRELYKTKEYSHRDLAKIFNLGKSEIGKIILNKKWVI